MGHNSKTLNTKLDVEKTLFLQWAERVRLLQQNPDDRLLVPATAITIDKVLNSLRGLLRDSAQLQARYGGIKALEPNPGRR
jgi:hypothetical protein